MLNEKEQVIEIYKKELSTFLMYYTEETHL